MTGRPKAAAIEPFADPVAFAGTGLATPEDVFRRRLFDEDLGREGNIQAHRCANWDTQELRVVFLIRFDEEGMFHLASPIDRTEPAAQLEDFRDHKLRPTPRTCRGIVRRADRGVLQGDH